MTTYGVTSAGFVVKTLAECRAEIEDAFKAAFGASINLDDRSVFGQLAGIFAEREAILWELAQAVYDAFDPDAAQGAGLDALAGLTGTLRIPASRSTVTETLTGTSGTVVPAGSAVAVVGTGARFDTTADATIASVPAWQAAHNYSVLGARVKNGGKVYQVITTGTSAGAGGPTGTAADVADNTVHWRYLGAGDGAVDVSCAAENTGPVVAASGTLTTIATPIGGWSGAINVLDADLGADLETDADLRLRREEEVAGIGGPSTDAIRAKILRIAGVISCTVFANTTDAVNADGMPAHSVEVLARGGADTDIAAAVWADVAAGPATTGNQTSTVVDATGASQTVKWSRPTTINIYVDVTFTYDATKFPADGDAQIKQAIVDAGDAYAVGRDVTASAQVAAAFAKVPGLLDVSPVKIGTAPAPGSSATIAISSRQLAVFDTSRITTSGAPATP